jgi:hypothetical protein
MRKIKIISGNIEVSAKIIDKNPETADLIWNSLPFESEVNTWGDEIYFTIPVETRLENSQETVEIKDLAYWPPGKAFCIFFGMTPISNDKIRPASPVNVFGKVIGDVKILKKIKTGSKIKVIKLE